MSRPSSSQSNGRPSRPGSARSSNGSPAEEHTVPTVKTGGDLLDRADLASGSLFSTLRVAKKTDLFAQTMQAKKHERSGLQKPSSFNGREPANIPLPLANLLPKSNSMSGGRAPLSDSSDSFQLAPSRFGAPKSLESEPPTPSLRSVTGPAADGPLDLASLLPGKATYAKQRSGGLPPLSGDDGGGGGTPEGAQSSASFRERDRASLLTHDPLIHEQSMAGDHPFAQEPDMLAATWAFHKVTSDGGVGIDFQQLLGNSPEQLEQIHEALNETMLEDTDVQDAECSDRGEPAAAPYTPEEFPMDLLPAPATWGGGSGGGAPMPLPGFAQSPGGAASPQSPARPGESARSQRTSEAGGQGHSVRSTGNSLRDDGAAASSPKQGTPEAAAAKAAAAAMLGASLRSRAVAKSLNQSIRDEAAAGAGGNADLLRSLRQQAKAEKMNTTIRVGFVRGKIKPLSIVIMVVGTRGDVQPFVGIALKLKEYGHRIRIASHTVFREFVESFGLEFYPIGGDPKVLSEFVVKHRGIMPGLDIKDALNQRDQVKQILYSTWGACVQPDPAHPDKPFRAEAIVSNPPAYGHIHCAEALNIPLHMVFTMPWTPTKAFPQPFARIKTTLGEGQGKAREIMNWLSYFAVEDLTWLGMSGMVKDFRQTTLKLKNWNKYTTSHATYYSKVPMTYVWSPSMVPRPKDWPSYIEVVGFINVELNKLTSFTPPKELTDFMKAGPPPIYIGFGSLVMEEPEKLTKNFLTAITSIGARAIIQRGWGGLGAGVKKVPDSVLFIDGCPHDWLFPHMAAVVHHGGAGTTATGLYAGKPTFIVPFFGDQPFWGAACFQCGVGPEPVAIDDLTTARITAALKDLLMPGRQKMALEMMARMHEEDGISATVDHMHRTIYESTLAGRPHIWMKPKAPEDVAMVTSIQELHPAEAAKRGIPAGEDDGSFLQGMLHMFGKKKLPAAAAVPVSKSTPSLKGPPGLPRADSKTGRSASTPDMARAASEPRNRASDNGSEPGPTPPVVADAKRNGGFFSFLGC